MAGYRWGSKLQWLGLGLGLTNEHTHTHTHTFPHRWLSLRMPDNSAFYCSFFPTPQIVLSINPVSCSCVFLLFVFFMLADAQVRIRIYAVLMQQIFAAIKTWSILDDWDVGVHFFYCTATYFVDMFCCMFPLRGAWSLSIGGDLRCVLSSAPAGDGLCTYEALGQPMKIDMLQEFLYQMTWKTSSFWLVGKYAYFLQVFALCIGWYDSIILLVWGAFVKSHDITPKI